MKTIPWRAPVQRPKPTPSRHNSKIRRLLSVFNGNPFREELSYFILRSHCLVEFPLGAISTIYFRVERKGFVDGCNETFVDDSRV